jgi:hypothetical protein
LGIEKSRYPAFFTAIVAKIYRWVMDTRENLTPNPSPKGEGGNLGD